MSQAIRDGPGSVGKKEGLLAGDSQLSRSGKPGTPGQSLKVDDFNRVLSNAFNRNFNHSIAPRGGLNSITSHMGCVGHDPFFFLFLPLCTPPSEGSLTSGRGFILGISVGEHFISSLEWRGICPRLAMARLHNFGRPSGHISAQRSWSLYPSSKACLHPTGWRISTEHAAKFGVSIVRETRRCCAFLGAWRPCLRINTTQKP